MSTSDFATELRELRDRVEQLEAERDILRVLHSYGPALDYGDEQGWADCFTEDAVFESIGQHVRRPFHVEGREALLQFASRHSCAPETLHKHCVFGTKIDLDLPNDRAAAVSYFALLYNGDAGAEVIAFGRYHDSLVRVDGQWRFARRQPEVETSSAKQVTRRPQD